METSTQSEPIDYSWNMKVEEEEQKLLEDMWRSRTGLNEETLCGAIEALIYMSEKPLTIQKIKKAIDEDMPLRVIYDSIEKLQNEYKQSHHGIRLVEVAQGYQFRSKVQYSRFIKNIHRLPVINLSPLALEVLSIIAFKQPISKTDVDTMRGVDSAHVLRALMDKKLIKVLGRSDETGKPSLYGTSDEFLEIFDLNTLDDLPSMNDLLEMAQENTVGDIEDIKEIVGSAKDTFMFDDIDELDQLSKNIKSISPHTEFTKLLKENTEKKKTTEQESPENEVEEIIEKTAFDILEEYIEPPRSGEEIEISAAHGEWEPEEIQELEEQKAKLAEELDQAFAKMMGVEEEVLAQEVESTEDEEDDLTEFEISDLSAIQKKIEDMSSDSENSEQ